MTEFAEFYLPAYGTNSVAAIRFAGLLLSFRAGCTADASARTQTATAASQVVQTDDAVTTRTVGVIVMEMISRGEIKGQRLDCRSDCIYGKLVMAEFFRTSQFA